MILIFLFLFTLPRSASAAPLAGDLNGDGRADVKDAILLLKALVNPPLSPALQSSADLDGSGQVNIKDAVLLLKWAVGMATPPPPISTLSTARFHVDVSTGNVSILPQSNGSSGSKPLAVFAGSSLTFNSSVLLDQPGDAGMKLLSVSLTNHSGLTIGQLPNGTTQGIRLLFSDITNLSTPSDPRLRTTVTTFAGTGLPAVTDGPVNSAAFLFPSDVAVGSNGVVYVADLSGNCIRKISGSLVSTLAGGGFPGGTDGAGTAATFNAPRGLGMHPDGSIIVTDYNGNRIRRVTPDGRVTTVAGTGAAGTTNGFGSAATFQGPEDVVVDGAGAMYVTEFGGNQIRKIVLSGTNPMSSSHYTVSTLAGNNVAGSADGVGPAAQFIRPAGIDIDPQGNLYVADYLNNRIRRISPLPSRSAED